jgi:hypothetical protein
MTCSGIEPGTHQSALVNVHVLAPKIYDKQFAHKPRLRVRGGVSGLRVVDGSVMPTIVTGNINAPIVMIAERAADFIKQESAVPQFFNSTLSFTHSKENK